MSIFFRAREILEMAEQIERNGGRFYRKAAENVSDAAGRDLLLGLAEMEDVHLTICAEMKKALPRVSEGAPAKASPDTEMLYLQVWADGHVFDLKSDPVDKLTGSDSIEDILQIAIGIEKESIIFYLGLKDAVPTQRDREQVDKIIK